MQSDICLASSLFLYLAFILLYSENLDLQRYVLINVSRKPWEAFRKPQGFTQPSLKTTIQKKSFGLIVTIIMIPIVLDGCEICQRLSKNRFIICGNKIMSGLYVDTTDRTWRNTPCYVELHNKHTSPIISVKSIRKRREAYKILVSLRTEINLET